MTRVNMGICVLAMRLALAGCSSGAEGYSEPAGPYCPGDDDTCGKCEAMVRGKCTTLGVAKCPDGFARDGCGCKPLLADDCPARTFPVLGGSCEPAGPQECADGFVHVAAGGCEPVLDECGQDGLPVIGGGCLKVGDVSSCGEGEYGDIPDAEGTVYVNPTYDGGGSNGSKKKPYTTIPDAYDAAAEGATIALAAGTYFSSPRIEKSIHLRGRCAKMTVLRGQLPMAIPAFPDFPATLVIDQTSDVTIVGVTLEKGLGTGWQSYAIGVCIHKSKNVVVRNSTISNSRLLGIHIKRSDQVTVRRCIIENTIENGGENGGGINFEGYPANTNFAEENIVRNNHGLGIRLSYTSGELRNNLVVDTRESTKTGLATGILVQECPTAMVDRNVVRGTVGYGIKAVRGGEDFFPGSDVKISANLVEGGEPGAADGSQPCMGLAVVMPEPEDQVEIADNTVFSPDCAGITAADTRDVSIIGNTIRDAGMWGIALLRSDGSVSSNLVADVSLSDSPTGAVGIIAGTEEEQADLETSVRNNRVRNIGGTGLFLSDCAAEVKHNHISDIGLGQGLGMGLVLQPVYDSTVSNNLIERVEGFGIWFSRSTGELEGNVVREIGPSDAVENDDIESMGTAITALESSDFGFVGNAVLDSSSLGLAAINSCGRFEGNSVEDIPQTPGGGLGFGIYVGWSDPMECGDLVIKDNTVSRASAAGIYASSLQVTIEGNMVEGTRWGAVEDEAGEKQEAADGVHLFGTTFDMRRNNFANNERIGALIDESTGPAENNLVEQSGIGMNYQNQSDVKLEGNWCCQVSKMCAAQELGLPLQKKPIPFPEPSSPCVPPDCT